MLDDPRLTTDLRSSDHLEKIHLVLICSGRHTKLAGFFVDRQITQCPQSEEWKRVPHGRRRSYAEKAPIALEYLLAGITRSMHTSLLIHSVGYSVYRGVRGPQLIFVADG
jgi:hypothetical protein